MRVRIDAHFVLPFVVQYSVLRCTVSTAEPDLTSAMKERMKEKAVT